MSVNEVQTDMLTPNCCFFAGSLLLRVRLLLTVRRSMPGLGGAPPAGAASPGVAGGGGGGDEDDELAGLA